MKSSNTFKAIIAAGLIITTTVGLTGCTNKGVFNFTSKTDYAVIKEGDSFVLHEVKSWVNESNDMVTITTECCNNQIWTTFDSSVLYKEKPSEHAYNQVCEHIHE